MTTETQAGENGLERLAAQAQAETDRLSVAQIDNSEAVNAAANRPLYAERQKVYPKRVYGIFRNLKWLVMAVSLGVYYLTPWLRWDRGPGVPDQAVLLDMPNRKFYFFFIEIWPQEVYFLTGLLILAALCLFLATSLFGRVWCGYACPQTVWTDLFVTIERWIEGDRNARMRLDKAEWTLAKALKKISKHIIWVLIAIATGGAWVFYFADAPTLAQQLLHFDAPTIAYIFIGLFAIMTYLLGGLAREQVCTYMCPWPRIQGAMFDEDSLLVSYRVDRGEPRGAHKKDESWDGRGDCVDCRMCVAVCPMGIDIRHGPQLECIQCALCIDACNGVMDKVGRPRGLITYDTFTNIDRRAKGLSPIIRLVRPRTIVYAALIALVSAIMVWGLGNRSTLELNVLRDRNPVYVTLSDGAVRNGYTVKILNKAPLAKDFVMSIEGFDHATIHYDLSHRTGVIHAPRDDIETAKIYIEIPADEARRKLDRGNAEIMLVLKERNSGEVIRHQVSFKGPKAR